MTSVIRRATAADADALKACIAAAYAPFQEQGLALPPVSEGIEEDIQDHDVWVAVIDGQVMGGVVLVFGDAAHLANLAVHPDAGGQGLGKALIAAAEDAARHAGYDRLQLATHDEMRGTQAFYRRLGWSETGRDGIKVYFARQL